MCAPYAVWGMSLVFTVIASARGVSHKLTQSCARLAARYSLLALITLGKHDLGSWHEVSQIREVIRQMCAIGGVSNVIG